MRGSRILVLVTVLVLMGMLGTAVAANEELAGNWISEKGESLRLESSGRFEFAGDGGFYEVRGENIVFYYDASGVPDEMPYAINGEGLVIGKGSQAERFKQAE